jgi:CheY-like chemotaxis protein
MTPRHDDSSSGPNDAPRPQRTILLVEDDDAVRGLLHHVLEREGYTILMAGDGPAGLAVAQTHSGPIDLLLTDIVMPRMTGRQLADEVRTCRPELPVLFMSGFADSGTVQLWQERGREGLLLKPFRPAELVVRIKGMLGET